MSNNKVPILLFIFIIVTNFYSVKTKSLSPARIMGGQSTNIENFPYQVSLVYIDFHICGGSIITERFVLTAAHCTLGITAPDLRVRVGSSHINSDGTLIPVQNLYEHSSFNPETFNNDIAVLALSGYLQFGDKISAIALPPRGSAVNDGALGLASGWGLLSEGGFLPMQLQFVAIPTVNIEDCRIVFSPTEITDGMICAGYPEGGKDTCQGDSGGPFAIDGVLVGITSWGESCGQPNTPGIYTKVSYYRDFIDSLIAN